MKIIGTATLVLSGLVVAGIAYMGWSSLPDLKRYLRMRSM